MRKTALAAALAFLIPLLAACGIFRGIVECFRESSSTGLYSLYSVIDGTPLLDGEYEDVHVSGSYLYVQGSRGCDVYRIIEE